MTVLLDDKPLDSAPDRLADALEAARQRLGSGGRVVVEVHLDGKPLTGADLDDPARQPLDGHDLRLYSADAKTLALSILDQVRERLGEARTLQADAADLLRQDRAQDGLRKVGSAIEVWLQVQQAASQSAGLLGVDLDALRFDGKSIPDIVNDLLDQLRELKGMIEAGDTVGLADALLYEWDGSVDRWVGVIDALSAKIESPA
ncbi:MAG: hypothetical protein AAF288_09925 [Planctomycetota bacterium]